MANMSLFWLILAIAPSSLIKNSLILDDVFLPWLVVKIAAASDQADNSSIISLLTKIQTCK